MYDSWKTRIILYIRGKENGEMLKDSIDNGPYEFKSEITVKVTYGVTAYVVLKDLKTLRDKINDPIVSINKAMIFLSSMYHLKFPPTNNQLQTSSNPRTQATIQYDQVTVQNVQGKQSQGYTGNDGNNQALRAWVINAFGNTGATQPRDKMLLAQAQEAGVVLDKEQHDFLADSLEETDDCEDLQVRATTNFKADHVDAYDSDCDDKACRIPLTLHNI
ncbi:hypothetical protein Tco_1487863 [Tanacetum coccineum]